MAGLLAFNSAGFLGYTQRTPPAQSVAFLTIGPAYFSWLSSYFIARR
jgi:hypothetical protein